MTYTLLTALAALSASTLLLAGCDKQLTPESQDAGTGIGFEVAVEGDGFSISGMDEGTKAALKGGFTDGDIFKVYAYDGSTAVMSGVSVTKSSSGWACTGGPYLWTKGKPLNFYAFYPESLGTSLSGKTSETGVTAFTYSPLSDGGKDVNGQTDYLLASYKGTGNNEGKAPLSFSHPLASIQFKCGSFDSTFGTISSIEIKGFYNYGTCTPTCGNSAVTYSWDSQNYSSTATLSQTGLSVSPATNAAIGEPFVLIPGQNFSTSGRSLNVTVKSSTGRTATGTLSQNTALAAGKTSVFKINYIDGDKITFSPVTVTSWGSNEGGTPKVEGDYRLVDLGLSVLWAECNLGAYSKEDAGFYYTWANIQGCQKNATNNGWVFAGTQTPVTSWGSTYYNASPGGSFSELNIPIGREQDAAFAATNGNLRMPSEEEFKELAECPCVQTTVNGVYGFQFTGKNGNTLFLPAAGHINDSGYLERGNNGPTAECEYWSTSCNKMISNYSVAFNAFISEGNHQLYRHYMESSPTKWMNIRPVQGESLFVDGEFTVNASGKKVRFSRGNLYWDGSAFRMERRQYDFRHYYGQDGGEQYAIINGVRTTTPSGTVGSFFWSPNAAQARAATYNVSTGSSDIFFTNKPSDSNKPNPSFTVEGHSGDWRVLSSEEWLYLLDQREMMLSPIAGHGLGVSYNYADLTYDGVNHIMGILIYQDGHKSTYGTAVRNITSIPDRCAFIPFSGYRSDSEVVKAGECVILPGTLLNTRFAAPATIGDILVKYSCSVRLVQDAPDVQ